MITDHIKFQAMKKRKTLLNIISELLIIIGGILFGRPSTNETQPLIGVILLSFGIGVGVAAYIFRFRKQYRTLEEKEDDDATMKQIIDEFGIGMTIFGLVFILAMFIAGIVIFYMIGHSWYKVILFFFAYELVLSIHDFVKLQFPVEN